MVVVRGSQRGIGLSQTMRSWFDSCSHIIKQSVELNPAHRAIQVRTRRDFDYTGPGAENVFPFIRVDPSADARENDGSERDDDELLQHAKGTIAKWKAESGVPNNGPHSLSLPVGSL
jgi:hypothetical protein